MAQGDLLIFQEANAYMLDGNFGSTDSVQVALITNAVVPTAADSVPGMHASATTTYTECTAGGSYAAKGEVLDTWDNMLTQSGAVLTFDDTGPSITWAANPANPTDAYYAVIFNNSDTGLERAIAYIDLDGPIDMQAGALTITWHVTGIFTAVIT